MQTTTRGTTSEASSLTVNRPASGAVSTVSGAAKNLVFDFNPADAEFSRTDSGLQISFDDGSAIVVDDFFKVEDNPLPTMSFADGTVVASADFLAQFDMDLATAAGPGASGSAAGSGGSGEYADDAGALIDGVNRLGSLGTDYWGGGSGVGDDYDGFRIQGSELPFVAPSFGDLTSVALDLYDANLRTSAEDSSATTIPVSAGTNAIVRFEFDLSQGGPVIEGIEGPISWSVDPISGNLIGTQNGEPVVELTLSYQPISSGGTGLVTINATLKNPMDHEHGSDASGAHISNIVVNAVDSSGNTASIGVSVNVFDDNPIAEGHDAATAEMADTAADHNGWVYSDANDATASVSGEITVDFGADGAAANGGWASVAVAPGQTVTTADGKTITFGDAKWDAGTDSFVIKGTYDDGGQEADALVLTVHKDGTYTLEQLVNVNYPSPAPDEDGHVTVGKGVLDLTVSYKDTDGDTAVADVVITIDEIPVIRLSTDQEKIKEGNDITLVLSVGDDSGSSTDPNGNPYISGEPIDVVVRLPYGPNLSTPASYEEWVEAGSPLDGSMDFYFQLGEGMTKGEQPGAESGGGIWDWRAVDNGDGTGYYEVVVRIPTGSEDWEINLVTVSDNKPEREPNETVQAEIVGVVPQGQGSMDNIADPGKANALAGGSVSVEVEDATGSRVGIVCEKPAYEPEAGQDTELAFFLVFDADPCSLLSDPSSERPNGGLLQISFKIGGGSASASDYDSQLDFSALTDAGFTVTDNGGGSYTLTLPSHLLNKYMVNDLSLGVNSGKRLDLPIIVQTADDNRSEFDEGVKLEITGVDVADKGLDLFGQDEHRVWTENKSATGDIYDQDVLTFTLSGETEVDPASTSASYVISLEGTVNVCDADVVLKVSVAGIGSGQQVAKYGDDMSWGDVQDSVADAFGYESYQDMLDDPACGVTVSIGDDGTILISIPKDTTVPPSITITMDNDTDVFDGQKGYEVSLDIASVDGVNKGGVIPGESTEGGKTHTQDMAVADGSAKTEFKPTIDPEDTRVVAIKTSTNSIHESELPGGSDSIANQNLVFTVGLFGQDGKVANALADTSIQLTITDDGGGGFTQNATAGNGNYQNKTITVTLQEGEAYVEVGIDSVKFYNAAGELTRETSGNPFGFSDDVLSNSDTDGTFTVSVGGITWGGDNSGEGKPTVADSSDTLPSGYGPNTGVISVEADGKGTDPVEFDGPDVNIAITPSTVDSEGKPYPGETVTITLSLSKDGASYSARESVEVVLELTTTPGVTYTYNGQTLTPDENGLYKVTVPANSASASIVVSSSGAASEQTITATIKDVNGNESFVGDKASTSMEYNRTPGLSLSGDNFVTESSKTDASEVTIDGKTPADLEDTKTYGQGAAEYTVTMDQTMPVNTVVSMRISLGDADITDFVTSGGSLKIVVNGTTVWAKPVGNGEYTFDVTIGKEQSSVSFSVPLGDDAKSEGLEDFTVSIDSAKSGTNIVVDDNDSSQDTVIIDDSHYDQSTLGDKVASGWEEGDFELFPTFDDMPLKDHQDGGSKGVYLHSTTNKGLTENPLSKYEDEDGEWHWPAFKEFIKDASGNVIGAVYMGEDPANPGTLTEIELKGNDYNGLSITVGIGQVIEGDRKLQFELAEQDVKVTLDLGSIENGRCAYGSLEDLKAMGYDAYETVDGNVYLQVTIPAGYTSVEVSLPVANNHADGGSKSSISVVGVWGDELGLIENADGYDAQVHGKEGLIGSNVDVKIKDDWTSGPTLGIDQPDKENNPFHLQFTLNDPKNLELREPADEPVTVDFAIIGSGSGAKAGGFIDGLPTGAVSESALNAWLAANGGELADGGDGSRENPWVITITDPDQLAALGFEVTNGGEVNEVTVTIHADGSTPDRIDLSVTIPEGETDVVVKVPADENNKGNYTILVTGCENGEASLDAEMVITVPGETNTIPDHDHTTGSPCEAAYHQHLVGISQRDKDADTDEESAGYTYFQMDTSYHFEECRPGAFPNATYVNASDFTITTTALVIGKTTSGSEGPAFNANDFVIGLDGMVHGKLMDGNTEVPGSTVILDPVTGLVTITCPGGNNNYTVSLPLANDQASEGSEEYTVIIQTVDVQGPNIPGGYRGDDEIYGMVKDGALSDTIDVVDGVRNGPVVSIESAVTGEEGSFINVKIGLDPHDPSSSNPDDRVIMLDQDIVLRIQYQGGSAKAGADFQVRETHVTIPQAGSEDFFEMLVEGKISLTSSDGTNVYAYRNAQGDLVTNYQNGMTFSKVTYNMEVGLVKDAVLDPNEHFTITVDHSHGGEASVDKNNNTTTVTIEDPLKPEVDVSVNYTNVTEGSTTVTVTVKLTDDKGTLIKSEEHDSTVIIKLTGGDGFSKSDITLPAGCVWMSGDADDFRIQVTIPAGQTHVNLGLTTVRDNAIEGPEKFKVEVVSGEMNGQALINDGSGSNEVTINDYNNPTVNVNVASTSVAEGEDLGLSLSLSNNAAHKGVTVTLTLSGVTEGDLEIPAGYNPTWSADGKSCTITATIPAGETTLNLTGIKGIGDGVIEANESIRVTLNGATATSVNDTNVALSTGSAKTITLRDSDAPTITFENAVMVEEGGTLSFTIGIDASETGKTDGYSQDLNINFTISNASLLDIDLENLPSGPGWRVESTNGVNFVLVVENGTPVDDVTLTFPVKDNDVVNANKTVTVSGGNYVAVDPDTGESITIGSGGRTTVTVTDDDTTTVSVGEAVSDAAEEGALISFDVELTDLVESPTLVTLTPEDGSTLTRSDFNMSQWPSNVTAQWYADGSLKSITVTVPANTASVTVNLPVLNDKLVEGEEQIGFELDSVVINNSGISNDKAILSDEDAATGTVTVPDTETATVSVNGNTSGVTEGSSAGFTVKLDDGMRVDGDVTATVKLTDDNGVIDWTKLTELYGAENVDKEAGTVRVTILAGTTSASVSVPTIDDAYVNMVNRVIEAEVIGVSSDYGDRVSAGDSGSVAVQDNDTPNDIKIVILAEWPLSAAENVTMEVPSSLFEGQNADIVFGNVTGKETHGYGELTVQDGKLVYDISDTNATTNSLSAEGYISETYEYTIKNADGSVESTSATVDVEMHVAPQHGRQFTYTDTEGADNYIVVQTGDRSVHIDAGAGNDIVIAGAGADIIRGGEGNDILYANAGGAADNASDIFLWAAGDYGTAENAAHDKVYGFQLDTDLAKSDLLQLDGLFGEGTDIDVLLGSAGVSSVDGKTVVSFDNGVRFEAKFLSGDQLLISLKDSSGKEFQTIEVNAADGVSFYEGATVSDEAAKAILQQMLESGGI